MTPDEVADAVFGTHTRDAPLPRGLYGIPCKWKYLFPGEPPEWWVEPLESVTPPWMAW